MTERRTPPSLAKSVLVTAVGTGFPPLAALATAPLLAQGLGVEARGQVAAAQAVTLLTVSLTGFGLPEAITYFVARGTRSRRGATITVICVAVLAGLAASLLVTQLSTWLGGNSPVTADLIRFASLAILPSLLLGLVRGYAAGREWWATIAAERIFGSLIRLIGTVLLLLTHNLTPHSATAIVVFGPLLAAFPYLLAFRPTRPTRDTKQGDTSFREILGYGGRVWVGAVSGILLMRMDQALLVPLAGAVELGLYAVAVSISEVPLVVNSAIRDVSFSRHSGKLEVEKLTQAARISGIASGTVALALAILLPWGIPLFFGAEFRDAIPVTLLLLLAVALGTPGSIAGAGLSALGKPGLRSISLTIAALVNVLVLIPAALHWGALGAATATLIGNAVSSNLNIHLFNRRAGATWTSFYVVRRTDLAAAARSMNRLARK